jgi:hypothetical protein
VDSRAGAVAAVETGGKLTHLIVIGLCLIACGFSIVVVRDLTAPGDRSRSAGRARLIIRCRSIAHTVPGAQILGVCIGLRIKLWIYRKLGCVVKIH